MNTTGDLQSSWSTSSYGDLPAASNPDMSIVSTTVEMRSGTRSHFSTVQCIAESAHGFIAARFVTTLVVAMVVASIFSLLL